jgi:hypothetical protein
MEFNGCLARFFKKLSQGEVVVVGGDRLPVAKDIAMVHGVLVA